MKYIDMETRFGERFSDCAERAIKKFNQYKLANPNEEFQVRFEFNEIILYIDEKSSIDLIVNEYEFCWRNNLKAYNEKSETENEIER